MTVVEGILLYSTTNKQNSSQPLLYLKKFQNVINALILIDGRYMYTGWNIKSRYNVRLVAVVKQSRTFSNNPVVLNKFKLPHDQDDSL